jgi:hypothetical protein
MPNKSVNGSGGQSVFCLPASAPPPRYLERYAQRMSWMPNFIEHARSLAQQIAAEKDRVRNLTRHWPTDGAHKEEILRAILTERLPARFRIENGFVVTADAESSQIDIMIVDSERPVVSRDANGTVYVTPDAVRAIIEVKTRLRGKREFLEAFRKLAANVSMCSPVSVWTGLFVIEEANSNEVDFWDGPDDQIITAADEASGANETTRVSCVSYGSQVFVRYWHNSMLEADGCVDGPAWHSYCMFQLAPAYFVGNLVDSVCGVDRQYSRVWFPIPDGKETTRRWYLQPGDQPKLFPEFRKSASGMTRILDRA